MYLPDTHKAVILWSNSDCWVYCVGGLVMLVTCDIPVVRLDGLVVPFGLKL